MKEVGEKALKGIRALYFEIIKSSDEQDRRFVIEDMGSYCDLQLTVRVLDPELKKTLKKNKINPDEIMDVLPQKKF